jgi:mannosyltransferase OCH1-like enzyme
VFVVIMTGMIPRKINFCWFGDEPANPLIQKCMQSWHSAMPDFEIRRWDAASTPLNNAYTRQAYARGLWARLSNYVRLHALYMEGGIYLDTDVEVLKSIAPLLDDRCFLGFQQAAEHKDCEYSGAGRRAGTSLHSCLHGPAPALL